MYQGLELIDLLEDNKILSRITEDEYISFFITQQKIKILVNEFALHLVLHSNNINNASLTENKTGIKIDKYRDLKLNNGSHYFDEKTKFNLSRGVEYFIKNLKSVITDSLEDLLIESAAKTILEESEEGDFINSITENDFFNQLMKIRNRFHKQRLNARRAKGSKFQWTRNKRKELLAFYETNLVVIRNAKKDYRKIKSFRNWKEAIKSNYSQLPVEVISALALGKLAGEPKYLTLYFASLYFDSTIDYLNKILSKAKKEAKTKLIA